MHFLGKKETAYSLVSWVMDYTLDGANALAMLWSYLDCIFANPEESCLRDAKMLF